MRKHVAIYLSTGEIVYLGKETDKSLSKRPSRPLPASRAHHQEQPVSLITRTSPVCAADGADGVLMLVM